MAVVLVFLLAVGIHQSCGNLLGKVVKNGQYHDSNVGRLSILHQPHPVEFVEQAGEIPLEEISSVFSLALGFSVFKDLEWQGLLSGNPFVRPKALLAFTVIDDPSGGEMKIKERIGFPIKWDGKGTGAENVMAIGPRNSLANHITAAFGGNSLTASVAASEKVASSGHSDSERSETTFRDERDGIWKSFIEGKAYDIPQESLEKGLQSIQQDFKDLRITVTNKKARIKVKDGEVSYDLSLPEVKSFFDEMGAIVIMSEKALNKQALVMDGATDVFSYFVTTLKGISQAYGLKSPQFKASQKLVSSVIEKVGKMYEKAYNGNILIASIRLREERSMYSEEEVNSVYQKLKSGVEGLSLKNFHQEFPALHLLKDVEDQARRSLCDNIKGVLASFSGDLKFKCANRDDSEHRLQRRSLLAAKAGTGLKDSGKKNGTENMNLAAFYDPNFPIIFNIWFWLFVVLVITMYAISLVMWFMDPGKDSIIYRMTSQRIKTD